MLGGRAELFAEARATQAAPIAMPVIGALGSTIAIVRARMLSCTNTLSITFSLHGGTLGGADRIETR